MTFKEYVDSLPKEAKKWIFEHCYDWTDENSPDYYQHNTVDDHVFDRCNKYERTSVAVQAILLKRNDEYVVNLDMTEEERFDYVYNLIINKAESSSAMGLIKLLPLQYYRKYANFRAIEENLGYDINRLLLSTEDFSNIQWKKLTTSSYIPYKLCAGTLQMLPYDIARALAKDDYTRVDFRDLPINCDLFDDLFFCEDGWSDSDKERIIRYTYESYFGSKEKATSVIADFMKRIVAVDKKYLRYIYDIINRNDLTLAGYLYHEVKPADELATCKKKYKYRYSEEYRRLFWIVRCCLSSDMSKRSIGIIGGAAAIIKMYGKDFDTIFDMLYPEYAQASNN